MLKPCAVFTLALGVLLGLWTRGFAESTLYAHDVLFYGQSIVAPACYYSLTMQTDGNLVLYDNSGHPVWASGTVGHRGYTVMQTDGNLVMYTWNGVPVWSTGTWRYPGAIVAMQNDGNLVVYHGETPVWASGTAGESLGSTRCPASAVTATEPDVDRPGGDYVVYPMTTPHATHCAYWCSQDPRCQAFTYVPPGGQGSDARCWLKDTIPGAVDAPGMVSGWIVH